MKKGKIENNWKVYSICILEKEKETRKLLESDLLSLTGGFSDEKRRNAELEEKAANLMK